MQDKTICAKFTFFKCFFQPFITRPPFSLEVLKLTFLEILLGRLLVLKFIINNQNNSPSISVSTYFIILQNSEAFLKQEGLNFSGSYAFYKDTKYCNALFIHSFSIMAYITFPFIIHNNKIHQTILCFMCFGHILHIYFQNRENFKRNLSRARGLNILYTSLS